MRSPASRELGVSAATISCDLKPLYRELGIWPAAPDPMAQVRELLAEVLRLADDDVVQEHDRAAAPIS